MERIYMLFQIFFYEFVSSCAPYILKAHVHRICSLLFQLWYVDYTRTRVFGLIA
jgi:hypothetical protein